jgi:hypothetical protein
MFRLLNYLFLEIAIQLRELKTRMTVKIAIFLLISCCPLNAKVNNKSTEWKMEIYDVLEAE